MDINWLRYLRLLLHSDDSGDIDIGHFKNTRTIQSDQYRVTDDIYTAKEQNIKNKILSGKIDGRSHKVFIRTDNYTQKPKLYNIGIGLQYEREADLDASNLWTEDITVFALLIDNAGHYLLIDNANNKLLIS